LAYNEDRDKYESDLADLKQAGDTRLKIIKAKLIALFDGTRDNAMRLSVEELLEHISFRLISHQRQSSPLGQRRAATSL